MYRYLYTSTLRNLSAELRERRNYIPELADRKMTVEEYFDVMDRNIDAIEAELKRRTANLGIDVTSSRSPATSSIKPTH